MKKELLSSSGWLCAPLIHPRNLFFFYIWSNLITFSLFSCFFFWCPASMLWLFKGNVRRGLRIKEIYCVRCCKTRSHTHPFPFFISSSCMRMKSWLWADVKFLRMCFEFLCAFLRFPFFKLPPHAYTLHINVISYECKIFLFLKFSFIPLEFFFQFIFVFRLMIIFVGGIVWNMTENIVLNFHQSLFLVFILWELCDNHTLAIPLCSFHLNSARSELAQLHLRSLYSL